MMTQVFIIICYNGYPRVLTYASIVITINFGIFKIHVTLPKDKRLSIISVIVL